MSLQCNINKYYINPNVFQVYSKNRYKLRITFIKIKYKYVANNGFNSKLKLYI